VERQPPAPPPRGGRGHRRRRAQRLYEELARYPNVNVDPGAAPFPASADVLLAIRLRTAAGVLAFFSTMTVFGTALDVTLDELAIEAFYPADAETAGALQERGRAGAPPAASALSPLGSAARGSSPD
jgi:MmyB-like transcription regulator ligand binding domain